MRVGIDQPSGQTDQIHQLIDLVLDLLPVQPAFDQERLCDRLRDRHSGVQRRKRILKNDLHIAPQSAELRAVHAGDILSFEQDLPVRALQQMQEDTSER